MDKLALLKSIDIKLLIERETGQKFNQNNFLPSCPFCKSGEGLNATPAFSLKIQKNIFKCFACDKSGNPIEFVMYFKNLEFKAAIQYLEKEYFSSAIMEKPKQKVKSVNNISKSIYAIRQNPKDKADEYLKSRAIEINHLPENSYFYDSIENAVVFIDNQEKLINKRFINQDGKLKARFVKGSTIKNAIYDKLFKPGDNTIYFVEGVINALSIADKSVIAIFTTSNKLDDLDKIIPYITNKNIVIAFDNDAAGNNCSGYYFNLFKKSNVPIHSIERLILPINKDINDLKIEVGLLPWLYDKNNYKCISSTENSDIIFGSHAKVDELYIRVGTAYYYKGNRKTSKGKEISELILWKIGTIKGDYGIKEIDKIPKYVSFINIPNNTPNYKRIIDGYYNLYEPLKYAPNKGDCPATIEFLRHIFQEKIHIALDYLTIIYKYPTQNLPVVCLISKQQRTGKSTFLKWLCAIYGNNSIILGNEDFAGNFNSHYATRLIICIDESFIEKRLIKEKIKRLSTDDTINLEAKGRDIIRIDFIGKFILTSNNEDNFIQMDSEDSRFFVIKIEKPQTENPFLLEELEKEIPAFLHLIENRNIEYKKESRLWFKPETYVTDALTRIIKSSRSKVELALIEYFENVFCYEDVGNQIECAPKNLAEQVERSLKNYSNLPYEIARILKNEWNLKPNLEVKRFLFPVFSTVYEMGNEEQTIKIIWIKYSGRPYLIEKEFINQIK